MLVGHYGPSFAAKAWKTAIPLWILFLAAQFLDILWAIFVMIGVEKVRITPGITASNPLDLYFMPYTHSFPAAVIWSLVAVGAYRVWFRGADTAAAATVGACVFSHWILDLVVHRPDLGLCGDTCKVGLGLWNYPVIAFALEMSLLFGGMILYLRSTRPKDNIGRYGMLVFGLTAAALQAYVFFGPPPVSDRAAAMTALALYLAFTAIVYWLEGKRS